MKEIVGEIELKDTQKIVVTVEKYYETFRVHFRLHYLPDPYKYDKWKPSGNGFFIDTDKWENFKNLVIKTEEILMKIKEKDRLSRLEQLDMFT